MAIACQNFGIFCLIIGCLLLCYCFNKTLLDNGKKLEEENGQKLNEINVKIQHNENEEKITLSPKKKEDNVNEIKLDKNEDTYVEIDEEEIKDKFKEKSNNQFENNKKSVIKIETSFNSQINSNNLNISSNNKINTVKNSTIKSNYNNINSLNLFESQNNNIYQNYEPKALNEDITNIEKAVRYIIFIF